MELFGTLLLLERLWNKTTLPSTYKMYIEAATDNQGNSMSIYNSRAKAWPSSIIFMQLIWSAHNNNLELGIDHELRENNKWADQLAGGDSDGFDPENRMCPSLDTKRWDLLSMFTMEEALKRLLECYTV